MMVRRQTCSAGLAPALPRAIAAVGYDILSDTISGVIHFASQHTPTSHTTGDPL